MKFTCLDCGTEFGNDEESAQPGSTVQCPECGRPHVVPETNSPLPDVLKELMNSGDGAFGADDDATPGTGTEQASEDAGESGGAGAGAGEGNSGSSFQRPMRAFSSHMKIPVPVPTQVSKTLVDVKNPVVEMEAIKEPSEDSIAQVVPAESPMATDGSGTWVVESPTGLVLEFPSATLLVGWAAVIENTAPYMVSRPGEESRSLDEFVTEIKRGKRPTQAFPKTGKTSLDREAGAVKSTGSMTFPMDEKTGNPGERRDSGVMNSSQFQFKIQNSSPPAWRGWVVALAIAIGVAAVAGGAAFVYVVLLK